MDVKKKIIITGQKVHDIGYRPFLLGIAESLGIESFFAVEKVDAEGYSGNVMKIVIIAT